MDTNNIIKYYLVPTNGMIICITKTNVPLKYTKKGYSQYKCYVIFDPNSTYSAGQTVLLNAFDSSNNVEILEEDINLFFHSREQFFDKCAYYYI